MRLRWLAALLLLAALGLAPAFASAAEKRILGPTARVSVPETGLSFLGRVDTGAATTSIHATDIEFEEGAALEAPVGARVFFSIHDEEGQSRRLSAKVEKVQATRTSEGREERLCVYLWLELDGVRKKVLVNLNDRSAMRYALLLGRNWLEDDFLVDVARR